MNKQYVSRRGFLKTALGGAAGLVLLPGRLTSRGGTTSFPVTATAGPEGPRAPAAVVEGSSPDACAGVGVICASSALFEPEPYSRLY